MTWVCKSLTATGLTATPPKKQKKKKKNPNTPLLLKGAVRLGRHTVLID